MQRIEPVVEELAPSVSDMDFPEGAGTGSFLPESFAWFRLISRLAPSVSLHVHPAVGLLDEQGTLPCSPFICMISFYGGGG